ncbi:hypothetical protein, partial [uncultured Bacteroides sp.]|uniref:hypothetical protein n=1 Tax=uncultured Bacteroides sp. TaxID=162156 RepID=UPI00267065EE
SPGFAHKKRLCQHFDTTSILGTLAKNTYFCPTNIEKLFCFSFFMFPQKEAEIKSKQFLNESSRIRKP